MFSFFKRPGKEADAVADRPRAQGTRPSNSLALDAREPLPLPQVIEGSDDSDWEMWKDSVLEQDSQLQSQYHDTVPSEFIVERHAEPNSDADPFSKVSKHEP